MTYTFKLSRRLAVVFQVGAVALVALVLVAVGFLLGSSSDTTPYLINGRSLAALLRSPIATKIVYLIVVGIGCAAGRVFPFQREFQGSREFLEHMFPGRTLLFYERTDFFISCVLGSIMGMIIVQPTSIHTALATGLGWPFIVRFLIEGMKNTGRPPENGLPRVDRGGGKARRSPLSR
ncbi:MAG TPA: hypothetical protein VGN76_16015 [Gemmatimonadales bacterium]|jgi:hypothetical protein|nr:hypothetical protein [Gemmatimonadales bacterium]